MSLSTRNGLLGSPGFGLRGNVVPLRRKKYPMCLYDGNTVAWYDSSDLTTITKDGSDYVSRWNDKLGSGHDLIQANGTKQPKWVVTDGVLFDGVNDALSTSFTYNSPQFIYLVLKQPTSKFFGYIFSLTAGSNIGVLYQQDTNGTIRLTDNLSHFANTSFVLNTYVIIRILFKDASSKIIINNNPPTFPSATFISITGTNFVLASQIADRFSNIQVKEVILRNVADNSTDETNIYNYLAKKHGFDLI